MTAKKVQYKFLPEDKDQLGEALHTGLRKGCDSRLSSFVWNLLQMDAFNPAWDRYLTLVWGQIAKVKSPIEAEKILFVALDDLIDASNRRTPELHCFQLSMEMLPKQDWVALSHWLFDGTLDDV